MRRAASLASPTSGSHALVVQADSSRTKFAADLKLFGLTYAAGFLVVSLFLA